MTNYNLNFNFNIDSNLTENELNTACSLSVDQEKLELNSNQTIGPKKYMKTIFISSIIFVSRQIYYWPSLVTYVSLDYTALFPMIST